MRKSLMFLAVSSLVSAPVLAQATAPTDSAQPVAKPQTVKKRVCYQEEEDSYSRLGGRKVCKTVEVPVKAPATGSAASQQAPATTNVQGK